MANNIAYSKAYIAMLDKKFADNGSTLIFNNNTVNAQWKNDKTVVLPDLTLEGLGTHTRGGNYVAGDVDIAWTDYTLAHERSKKFSIDAMDMNEARMKIATIASEFQRLKVVPEIDAYRFDKLVSLCGVDVAATLTYDNVLDAIDTAIETLDDAECPKENRVLFVSNATYRHMKASGEFFNIRIAKEINTNIHREIEIFDGMPLIRVPNSRFYDNFDFSATDGFAPNVAAKALNFAIVQLDSVMSPIKYAQPKIILPELNQSGSDFIFAYQLYMDLFVPKNALANVYIHSAA
jgi:hypothetical protein